MYPVSPTRKKKVLLLALYAPETTGQPPPYSFSSNDVFAWSFTSKRECSNQQGADYVAKRFQKRPQGQADDFPPCLAVLPSTNSQMTTNTQKWTRFTKSWRRLVREGLWGGVRKVRRKATLSRCACTGTENYFFFHVCTGMCGISHLERLGAWHGSEAHKGFVDHLLLSDDAGQMTEWWPLQLSALQKKKKKKALGSRGAVNTFWKVYTLFTEHLVNYIIN